ncbi:MAG: sigma-E processing peptidase SpoIIGA [Lachnospiraceae bacterium]|nr:sigma-E processing peptidase SpoIIGA [Lachnospiraceae bacterium]
MYYEVYLDSIFLVSFVIHLYLLLLIRRSLQMEGRWAGILLGAGIGGVGAVLPFFIGGNIWVKTGLCVLISTVLMIGVAFPVKNLKSLVAVGERLLLCSFFMGGGFLFILNAFPWLRKITMSLMGVLGLGGVLYLLFSAGGKRMWGRQVDCRVKLIRGAESVTIQAFVDTGNGLTEPISGKPVSVVEESILRGLWPDELPAARVIPYHAIGTKRGYMMGYLIPEIRIELGGVERSFQEVYIAAAPEKLQRGGRENIKMLVNPRMLRNDK